MTELGYENYGKILNAKDYGIPQNRERVFTISIKKDLNQTFEFPEPRELKLKLKDMLETEADESYYLSDDKIEAISHWKSFQKPFEKVQGSNSIVPTLTARGAGEEHSGMITYSDRLEDTTNLQEECLKIKSGSYARTYGSRGKLQEKEVCDTLTASMGTGGGNVPILKIKNATKKGYLEATDGDGVDISSLMKYHRGTVQKESIQTITTAGGADRGVVIKTIGKTCSEELRRGMEKEYNGAEQNYPSKKPLLKEDDYSQKEKELFTQEGNIRRYIGSDKVDEFKEGQVATTTYPNGYGYGPRTHDECVSLNTVDRPSVKNNLRIRKLTPKECWRLMGFDDDDFEKAEKVNSRVQLYKQAGNSIVVNVLEEILKNLIPEGERK